MVNVLQIIEPALQLGEERSRYIRPMVQLLSRSFSRSSVCRILVRVSEALARQRPNFIKMPETQAERKASSNAFFEIASFPRVIGAIDCTQVKIQSPGGDQAEQYRNRKGWFSFNVQTVAAANLKVINIVARWPGACHDQHIFNNSRLQMRLERGDFGNFLILGDSGYRNTTYLATPFLNVDTPAKNLYNESQIRTRNVEERSYGVLKRRFPVLSLGMRLKLETVQTIVVACAILHNIAIDNNDFLEDEPEPQQQDDDNDNIDDEGRDAGVPLLTSRDQLAATYFDRLLAAGHNP